MPLKSRWRCRAVLWLAVHQLQTWLNIKMHALFLLRMSAKWLQFTIYQSTYWYNCVLSPQGSEIFTVVAKDGDVGNPNPVIYSFDFGKFFKLKETRMQKKGNSTKTYLIKLSVHLSLQVMMVFSASIKQVAVSPCWLSPFIWRERSLTLKSG